MDKEALEILFHDDWIIAVNKPAGLLVHRTHLAPRETRFALNIVRDQTGCWVYPIHRLDKGTSGVLLFAKSQETASLMGHMVLNHEYFKSYLAIVRGYSPDKDTIDYPIPQGRYRERKKAVSHFETLERTELPYAVGIFNTARYSLVRIWPETGRRHQIRRHLKHINYNIIGDKLYGDRAHNRFYKEVLDIPQMLLHAYETGFDHPETGEKLLIRAPLPDHWKKALINFPLNDQINSIINEGAV